MLEHVAAYNLGDGEMLCENQKPTGSCPPITSIALLSSPLRRSATSARVRPMTFVPMLPSVAEMAWTRWPSSAHLAILPLARNSASSGCAYIASMFMLSPHPRRATPRRGDRSGASILPR